MAGSILGVDQVAKVNAAYPRLMAHIADLLKADQSGYGKMKVHFLTEFLDTTEIHAIFTPLPFLAPAEKRALVRAAIYEVLTGAELTFTARPFTAEETAALDAPTTVLREEGNGAQYEEKVFTPARFNLNVNRAANIHGQAPADVNVAKPVVTSTHTSKVAANVEAGNKRMAEQQAKLDAAVAKLRAENTSKPIEIMKVPADADLQQAASETPAAEE